MITVYRNPHTPLISRHELQNLSESGSTVITCSPQLHMDPDLPNGGKCLGVLSEDEIGFAFPLREHECHSERCNASKSEYDGGRLEACGYVCHCRVISGADGHSVISFSLRGHRSTRINTAIKSTHHRHGPYLNLSSPALLQHSSKASINQDVQI